MVCDSNCNILIRDYYLQRTNFMSPGDRESVVVSPVHTLRKKGKIKSASIHQRLPRFLVLSCNLNWLEDWGMENISGVVVEMVVGKNREMKNFCGIEEGNVTGDCNDNFVNKYGWNRDVKVDWSRGTDS